MKLLGLCISGLQDVAQREITAAAGAASPATINHTEDGLISYTVKDGADSQYTKLPLLNNLHEILCTVEDTPSLDVALTQLLAERRWQRPVRKVGERFRLMLSNENQLTSADKTSNGQMITRLEQLSGLSYSKGRSHADAEFWVMRRDNGRAYLTKRLTYSRKTEKDLAQGELRPELAHALCQISNPTPEDRVLDPFAGSGAIIFARARQAYNMLFAYDLNDDKVKAMKQALKTTHRRLERKKSPLIIRQGNALNLDKIEDGFISHVITDPPWGLFDTTIEDLDSFYRAMMQELCRVTRPGGVIVLLIGQRDHIAPLLSGIRETAQLDQRYDILVSGKKASILRFIRKEIKKS